MAQRRVRVGAARVAPDEGVEGEGAGPLELGEHERRVPDEVARAGERAEGDEIAGGDGVEAEAGGDEGSVDGLELTQVGAALRQRHQPVPCTGVAALSEYVSHVS